MGARLIGVTGDKEDVFTKRDAIDAYVALLRTEAEPEAALLRDARRQLAAASALASAAEVLAFATRPVMGDVAKIETAIGKLRSSREIYLASADKVCESRTAIDRVSRSLKTVFRGAIVDFGAAADMLAERAMRAPDTEGSVASEERISRFFVAG
ncbi:MAG: hypothetical protein AAF850_07655 [Pseudomonadota bacterium]